MLILEWRAGLLRRLKILDMITYHTILDMMTYHTICKPSKHFKKAEVLVHMLSFLDL
jgi:hypothetical protein